MRRPRWRRRIAERGIASGRCSTSWSRSSPRSDDRSTTRVPGRRAPSGRRMAAAVRPFADRFITPMAAVAGAVADEICAAMVARRRPASRLRERRWRHRVAPVARRDVRRGVGAGAAPAGAPREGDRARARADPRRGDERPSRAELLARHRRRGDRARRRRRPRRRRGHADRQRRRPARTSRDRADARVRAGARQRPRIALGHARTSDRSPPTRWRGRSRRAWRRPSGCAPAACSPPRCSACTIGSRRSRAPC